jgi:hypothetical protein
VTSTWVAYGESEMICSANARLGEWSRQAGLTCAAPSHATWQSVNDSRYAVLDSFFWWSKTDQMAIQGVESFLRPDPRLDHDLLQVRLSCDTLGSMQPLEALRAPAILNRNPLQAATEQGQFSVRADPAENDSHKQTHSTGHSSVFFGQGYVLQAGTQQGRFSVRGKRCRFHHVNRQVCLDVHVAAIPVSKNGACFFAAALGDLARLQLGALKPRSVINSENLCLGSRCQG